VRLLFSLLLLHADPDESWMGAGHYNGKYEEQPSTMGAQIKNAVMWLSSMRHNSYVVHRCTCLFSSLGS
jgi:hypothetical protein